MSSNCIITPIGVGLPSSDGPDQYANFVTLLMHMEGSNGGTTFLDERGHVFTRIGNPVTSTAQAKFGSTSALFNGSTDYLSTPASADFAFGTGDFTVEAWIYNKGGSIYQDFVGNSQASDGQRSWTFGTDNTGRLRFFGWNGAFLTSVSLLPLNTWVHVAIARVGTTVRIFINGKMDVSGSATPINMSNVQPLFVGFDHDNYWNGYVDELRITKGVGRYIADFAPPTAAFSL